MNVKDLEPLLVHAEGSGGDVVRADHVPLDSPAIHQFTDQFHVYPGSFRCSRDQSPCEGTDDDEALERRTWDGAWRHLPPSGVSCLLGIVVVQLVRGFSTS